MDPKYLTSDEARYECSVWGLPYEGLNDRQVIVSLKTQVKGRTAMERWKKPMPGHLEANDEANQCDRILGELASLIENDMQGNRREVTARFLHVLFRFLRAARAAQKDTVIMVKVRDMLADTADVLEMEEAKVLLGQGEIDPSVVTMFDSVCLWESDDEVDSREPRGKLLNSTTRDNRNERAGRSEGDQFVRLLISQVEALSAELSELKSSKRDNSLSRLLGKSGTSGQQTATVRSDPPTRELNTLANASTVPNTAGRENGSELTNPRRRSTRGRGNRSNRGNDSTNNGHTYIRRPVNLANEWGLKYAGEGRGLSFEMFEKLVRDAARGDGITEEQLFNTGPKFLEGQAKDDYLYWGPEANNWGEFLEKLKEASNAEINKGSLVQRMRDTVQRKGESYMVYRARMMDSVKMMTHRMPEMEIVELLLANMQGDLADKVMAFSVESLDDLDRAVKRVQGNLKMRNSGKLSAKTSTTKGNYTYRRQVNQVTSEKNCESASEEEGKNLEVNEVRNDNRYRGKGKTPYCYFCLEQGHWTNQCKYSVESLLNDQEIAKIIFQKFPEIKGKIPAKKSENGEKDRVNRK
jgi:hypothetical protein